MTDKKLESVVEDFVASIPGLNSVAEKYKKSELYDPEDRLFTIELGDCAWFIGRKIDDSKFMKLVFNRVEEIFFDTEEEDITALGFSFIEDLINCIEQNDRDPDELLHLLKPKTKQCYLDIQRFWAGE